jgi:glutamate/tyrosine decarboxylase-like PLP-dependent enzyme
MTSSDPLALLRTGCAQPLPHPDLPVLRQASQAVVDFALDEFARLPSIDPAATAARAEMERLLRAPPPEHATDFARVLADFQSKIAPRNMRPHHPRFLAFVPAAPTFVSVLGDWLCAATNAFAGVWKESAAAAQVELLVLDWFKQWMGYPLTAGGLLTGGGSEANLIALTVARERLAYEVRGRAMLYVSSQRHWSIDRAARVIGLRPDQVRVLPGEADFRLAPARLAAAVAQDQQGGKPPWLVVANAGATNTGAVDPLPELAALCRRHGLWLHADAAYGWPALLTERGRVELAGLEFADSVTLDPHKWLAQTYDVGCVLIRDGALLAQTFAMRPEYMQDVTPQGDEVNFADLGISLTRRFRALKIWLSLQVLGVAWFRRLVEHGICLAEYAQALLERAGCFEILSPRRLSTLCFRYTAAGLAESRLDELNRRICEQVQQTGRVFLATTQLAGRTAQRLCFVNWRTTAADVEEVVGLLHTFGERLAAARAL